MKKILFMLFILFCAKVFAVDGSLACKQSSDCIVGCKNEKSPPDCYPKSQIKINASDENESCHEAMGGLACGCKKEKCQYMLPQEKQNQK
ncbi:MAG TPA: hypothetical protein PLU50_10250 [Pseudobdellovibrionaceae bacterium]|nr:hypothetical protein [Pseudobdellovibrionaceae bacterium]